MRDWRIVAPACPPEPWRRWKRSVSVTVLHPHIHASQPATHLTSSIFQQNGHEHAAHDAPRDKGAVKTGIGHVPVAERGAIGRLTQETMQPLAHELKIFSPPGERAAPDDPVRFRVCLAAIKRHTIRQCNSAICLQFGGRDLKREKSQTKNPVPDKIVLEAPCVWTIKRDACAPPFAASIHFGTIASARTR